MKRTTIVFLSAAIVILMSGGVVLGLVLANKEKSDEPAGALVPAIGSSIASTETPDYKACGLTSPETIESVLQNGASEITAGERSGVIGHNGNKADVCTYLFATPKSERNSLTIQTYEAAAEQNTDKDQLAAEWAEVADAPLPTYFKLSDHDATKTGELRVSTGPRHVIWKLIQPLDALQFNEADILYVLTMLSSKADYAPATMPPDSQAIPPAPTYN